MCSNALLQTPVVINRLFLQTITHILVSVGRFVTKKLQYRNVKLGLRYFRNRVSITQSFVCFWSELKEKYKSKGSV